jgi:hypothetical protein
MYYIYHIEGIKVGCSTNPKQRVKAQGYNQFEILETHTDINIAAKREIELQNEYGYIEKNIHTDYVQQYQYGVKGRLASKGLGAKSQIENKIGIFGYSKEERQKLNASIASIGGNVTKEKYGKPIDMFDLKTGEFIKSFASVNSASKELKTSNIRRVLNGIGKHAKGYTFKYKTI